MTTKIKFPKIAVSITLSFEVVTALKKLMDKNNDIRISETIDQILRKVLIK